METFFKHSFLFIISSIFIFFISKILFNVFSDIGLYIINKGESYIKNYCINHQGELTITKDGYFCKIDNKVFTTTAEIEKYSIEKTKQNLLNN